MTRYTWILLSCTRVLPYFVPWKSELLCKKHCDGDGERDFPAVQEGCGWEKYSTSKSRIRARLVRTSTAFCVRRGLVKPTTITGPSPLDMRDVEKTQDSGCWQIGYLVDLSRVPEAKQDVILAPWPHWSQALHSCTQATPHSWAKSSCPTHYKNSWIVPLRNYSFKKNKYFLL